MRQVTRAVGLCGLAWLFGVGCKGANADVALSKKVAQVDESGANVPVPPEDGPKLFATRSDVPVLASPKKDATPIGALRLGGSVPRAVEPYRTSDDCPAGYYPVNPRGFVCASDGVTMLPLTSVSGPDTASALPYRYARVRSATPVYSRLPSLEQQLEAEPGLEKHLAKAKKLDEKALGKAGADDVPLDEHGNATGVPVVGPEARGGDGDGRRTHASYFDAPLGALPPLASDLATGPLVVRPLRRGSGLAILGSVENEGPDGTRRFVVTPEAMYVPADHLEPALGSTFHGMTLTADKNLPVAFTLRDEVCPYAMKAGKAARIEDEELDRRAPLALTGRFRTLDAVRYDEAVGGQWFRHQDLIKIVKRTKFPDFVSEGVKWVDVSLALQTVTLYEGKRAVYATLVSSGPDLTGDPKTFAATLQGTFPVARKALTQTVDPIELQDAFEVFDAPWRLEYAPGFALAGTYLNESFGEPRSYHDVALSPIDARRLFTWAGADVPSGFRWIAPADGETITVHVRK